MKVKNGDKISFICVDFNKDKRNILLNNELKEELKGQLGRMIEAFKVAEPDVENVNCLEEIVKAEMETQTGYSINDEELGRIINVGLVLVDGTDNFEHLFVANVTGLEQKTEGIDSSVYDLVWVSEFEVSVINTWRPFTIWKKTEFISQQMKAQEDRKTE